jgi:Na+/proline symporter
VRGILVASFFAAFLSTLSTQLNWGASYLLSDGYKRFVNRNASERHYLVVARWLPVFLALGAMGVAFANRTIGASFTLILNLTAGVGPVYLLRWFWWRVNAWSEIAAMASSLPILLLRPHALRWLGWPSGLLVELLFMVVGTALIWVPATLVTAPVHRDVLARFYAQVHPPGWWRPVQPDGPMEERWGWSVVQWLVSTVALLATTVGPLQLWLGRPWSGGILCAVAAAAWGLVLFPWAGAGYRQRTDSRVKTTASS